MKSEIDFAMGMLSKRMDTGVVPVVRPQGLSSEHSVVGANCANCVGQCNCKCAPKCRTS